jgi:acetylornithine deacetylase
MLDPVLLARQLIDIPSVTGEEGAVSTFIESTLKTMGLTTERQDIAPGRFNLLATSGRPPRVLLSTHTDTVPPFFASSETDEAIIGRGACDTKGILAAMLAAAERLLADGVRDFGFLLVVGEETDSIGAKRANEHYATVGSEYIVVGEPTGSKFVHASKGAFTAVVRFGGKAAHSAYPELGDSAIRKLVLAAEAVETADWGSDPLLGPGTVNIGVVRGGMKPNIIPDQAEMEMIFRSVEPWMKTRDRLAALVAPFGGEIVRGHGNDPTWMVVPEGSESIAVAFNTDVPHLGNLGAPLLFGPGSIHDAHGASENILKHDLVEAVGTYQTLVRSLLGGKVNRFNARTR